MSSITVVVSAYNEEAKLGQCLASVAWADEIVVVDNSSTDNTVKIAQKYTTKVYHQPNNPMLNVNKNYGFSKATGNWILNLDADERIPSDLAKQIQTVTRKKSAVVGYWIPRKNIIFGKWITHGLWWPDKQLRLFKTGTGKFPCKHVHEYLEVDGQTAQLSVPFIHYNYETISQYLRKMDAIYSESEVTKHKLSGYQLSWHDAIRFPVSDFVKVFFAQEGYKDGLHGLVLSLLQGFYSFIVFAKLWESQKFPERDISLTAVNSELDHAAKEVHWWELTAALKEAPSWLKRLWIRLIRRYATKN